PLVFLLAGVVCSLIGRGLLIRAAFSVGKGWGISVLLVPLAPLFFRWNYKELALQGRHWRTATVACTAIFCVTGGSGSLSDIPSKWTSNGDLAEAEDAPALSTAGSNRFLARIAGLVAPSDSSVPSALVPGATLEHAPEAASAVRVVSTPERLAANQREFARLVDVYAGLKQERGYLRKADVPAITAFNAQAAKYQADLATARAEQAELNQSRLVTSK
ncbi:MAG: hypothetical protein JWQ44_2342, partial [Chthoniobacter sp.]|nr:hypothetical protein [Chthoniobacter sp.]